MPRRQPLAILLIAAVLLDTGVPAHTGDALEQKPQPTVSATDVAQRIHKLVNAERKKHGLPALAWDTNLAAIAAKHSRDMARRNYLGHDSPEGHDFGHRYRQGGYTCQVRVGQIIHTGAENLALSRLYDSVTTRNGVVYYDWNLPEAIARKTVDGWMNSTGHRKNILAPHWRHQGIGIEISPDNRVIVTQNFC